MKTMWFFCLVGLVLLFLLTCVGCTSTSVEGGPTTRPKYYHVGTPFVTVIADVNPSVAKVEVWYQNSCVATLKPGGHAVVVMEGCQYMDEVTLIAKGYDANGAYVGVVAETFNTRRSYFPYNEPGRNFTWVVAGFGGHRYWR